MKIFKFDLKLGDNIIPLSSGSRFLKFDYQEERNKLVAWFLIDPDNWICNRIFKVHGTGAEVADNELYLGTALCDRGKYVWHLFEVNV